MILYSILNIYSRNINYIRIKEIDLIIQYMQTNSAIEKIYYRLYQISRQIGQNGVIGNHRTIGIMIHTIHIYLIQVIIYIRVLQGLGLVLNYTYQINIHYITDNLTHFQLMFYLLVILETSIFFLKLQIYQMVLK